MNYFKIQIAFVNYEGKDTIATKGIECLPEETESVKQETIDDLISLCFEANLNNPIDYTVSITELTEEEYNNMYPPITYDYQE